MKIAAFTKTYGKKTVLRFPACELPQGRIVAVIGANGSGKSTLAKVLSGIEPSDQRVRPLMGVSLGYLPQKVTAYILIETVGDWDRDMAMREAQPIALTRAE